MKYEFISHTHRTIYPSHKIGIAKYIYIYILYFEEEAEKNED